jgi:hypothetical protein
MTIKFATNGTDTQNTKKLKKEGSEALEQYRRFMTNLALEANLSKEKAQIVVGAFKGVPDAMTAVGEGLTREIENEKRSNEERERATIAVDTVLKGVETGTANIAASRQALKGKKPEEIRKLADGIESEVKLTTANAKRDTGDTYMVMQGGITRATEMVIKDAEQAAAKKLDKGQQRREVESEVKLAIRERIAADVGFTSAEFTKVEYDGKAEFDPDIGEHVEKAIMAATEDMMVVLTARLRGTSYATIDTEKAAELATIRGSAKWKQVREQMIKQGDKTAKVAEVIPESGTEAPNWSLTGLDGNELKAQIDEIGKAIAMVSAAASRAELAKEFGQVLRALGAENGWVCVVSRDWLPRILDAGDKVRAYKAGGGALEDAKVPVKTGDDREYEGHITKLAAMAEADWAAVNTISENEVNMLRIELQALEKRLTEVAAKGKIWDDSKRTPLETIINEISGIIKDKLKGGKGFPDKHEAMSRFADRYAMVAKKYGLDAVKKIATKRPLDKVNHILKLITKDVKGMGIAQQVMMEGSESEAGYNTLMKELTDFHRTLQEEATKAESRATTERLRSTLTDTTKDIQKLHTAWRINQKRKTDEIGKEVNRLMRLDAGKAPKAADCPTLTALVHIADQCKKTERYAAARKAGKINTTNEGILTYVVTWILGGIQVRDIKEIDTDGKTIDKLISNCQAYNIQWGANIRTTKTPELMKFTDELAKAKFDLDNAIRIALREGRDISSLTPGAGLAAAVKAIGSVGANPSESEVRMAVQRGTWYDKGKMSEIETHVTTDVAGIGGNILKEIQVLKKQVDDAKVVTEELVRQREQTIKLFGELQSEITRKGTEGVNVGVQWTTVENFIDAMHTALATKMSPPHNTAATQIGKLEAVTRLLTDGAMSPDDFNTEAGTHGGSIAQLNSILLEVRAGISKLGSPIIETHNRWIGRFDKMIALRKKAATGHAKANTVSGYTNQINEYLKGMATVQSMNDIANPMKDIAEQENVSRKLKTVRTPAILQGCIGSIATLNESTADKELEDLEKEIDNAITARTNYATAYDEMIGEITNGTSVIDELGKLNTAKAAGITLGTGIIAVRAVVTRMGKAGTDKITDLKDILTKLGSYSGQAKIEVIDQMHNANTDVEALKKEIAALRNQITDLNAGGLNAAQMVDINKTLVSLKTQITRVSEETTKMMIPPKKIQSLFSSMKATGGALATETVDNKSSYLAKVTAMMTALEAITDVGTKATALTKAGTLVEMKTALVLLEKQIGGALTTRSRATEAAVEALRKNEDIREEIGNIVLAVNGIGAGMIADRSKCTTLVKNLMDEYNVIMGEDEVPLIVEIAWLERMSKAVANNEQWSEALKRAWHGKTETEIVQSFTTTAANINGIAGTKLTNANPLKIASWTAGKMETIRSKTVRAIAGISGEKDKDITGKVGYLTLRLEWALRAIAEVPAQIDVAKPWIEKLKDVLDDMARRDAFYKAVAMVYQDDDDFIEDLNELATKCSALANPGISTTEIQSKLTETVVKAPMKRIVEGLRKGSKGQQIRTAEIAAKIAEWVDVYLGTIEIDARMVTDDEKIDTFLELMTTPTDGWRQTLTGVLSRTDEMINRVNEVEAIATNPTAAPAPPAPGGSAPPPPPPPPPPPGMKTPIVTAELRKTIYDDLVAGWLDRALTKFIADAKLDPGNAPDIEYLPVRLARVLLKTNDIATGAWDDVAAKLIALAENVKYKGADPAKMKDKQEAVGAIIEVYENGKQLVADLSKLSKAVGRQKSAADPREGRSSYKLREKLIVEGAVEAAKTLVTTISTSIAGDKMIAAAKQTDIDKQVADIGNQLRVEYLGEVPRWGIDVEEFANGIADLDEDWIGAGTEKGIEATAIKAKLEALNAAIANPTTLAAATVAKYTGAGIMTEAKVKATLVRIGNRRKLGPGMGRGMGELPLRLRNAMGAAITAGDNYDAQTDKLIELSKGVVITPDPGKPHKVDLAMLNTQLALRYVSEDDLNNDLLRVEEMCSPWAARPTGRRQLSRVVATAEQRSTLADEICTFLSAMAKIDPASGRRRKIEQAITQEPWTTLITTYGAAAPLATNDFDRVKQILESLISNGNTMSDRNLDVPSLGKAIAQLLLGADEVVIWTKHSELEAMIKAKGNAVITKLVSIVPDDIESVKAVTYTDPSWKTVTETIEGMIPLTTRTTHTGEADPKKRTTMALQWLVTQANGFQKLAEKLKGVDIWKLMEKAVVVKRIKRTLAEVKQMNSLATELSTLRAAVATAKDAGNRVTRIDTLLTTGTWKTLSDEAVVRDADIYNGKATGRLKFIALVDSILLGHESLSAAVGKVGMDVLAAAVKAELKETDAETQWTGQKGMADALKRKLTLLRDNLMSTDPTMRGKLNTVTYATAEWKNLVDAVIAVNTGATAIEAGVATSIRSETDEQAKVYLAVSWMANQADGFEHVAPKMNTDLWKLINEITVKTTKTKSEVITGMGVRIEVTKALVGKLSRFGWCNDRTTVKLGANLEKLIANAQAVPGANAGIDEVLTITRMPNSEAEWTALPAVGTIEPSVIAEELETLNDRLRNIYNFMVGNRFDKVGRLITLIREVGNEYEMAAFPDISATTGYTRQIKGRAIGELRVGAETGVRGWRRTEFSEAEDLVNELVNVGGKLAKDTKWKPGGGARTSNQLNGQAGGRIAELAIALSMIREAMADGVTDLDAHMGLAKGKIQKFIDEMTEIARKIRRSATRHTPASWSSNSFYKLMKQMRKVANQPNVDTLDTKEHGGTLDTIITVLEQLESGTTAKAIGKTAMQKVRIVAEVTMKLIGKGRTVPAEALSKELMKRNLTYAIAAECIGEVVNAAMGGAQATNRKMANLTQGQLEAIRTLSAAGAQEIEKAYGVNHRTHIEEVAARIMIAIGKNELPDNFKGLYIAAGLDEHGELGAGIIVEGHGAENPYSGTGAVRLLAALLGDVGAMEYLVATGIVQEAELKEVAGDMEKLALGVNNGAEAAASSQTAEPKTKGPDAVFRARVLNPGAGTDILPNMKKIWEKGMQRMGTGGPTSDGYKLVERVAERGGKLDGTKEQKWAAFRTMIRTAGAETEEKANETWSEIEIAMKEQANIAERVVDGVKFDAKLGASEVKNRAIAARRNTIIQGGALEGVRQVTQYDAKLNEIYAKISGIVKVTDIKSMVERIDAASKIPGADVGEITGIKKIAILEILDHMSAAQIEGIINDEPSAKQLWQWLDWVAKQHVNGGTLDNMRPQLRAQTVSGMMKAIRNDVNTKKPLVDEWNKQMNDTSARKVNNAKAIVEAAGKKYTKKYGALANINNVNEANIWDVMEALDRAANKVNYGIEVKYVDNTGAEVELKEEDIRELLAEIVIGSGMIKEKGMGMVKQTTVWDGTWTKRSEDRLREVGTRLMMYVVTRQEAGMAAAVLGDLPAAYASMRNYLKEIEPGYVMAPALKTKLTDEKLKALAVSLMTTTTSITKKNTTSTSPQQLCLEIEHYISEKCADEARKIYKAGGMDSTEALEIRNNAGYAQEDLARATETGARKVEVGLHGETILTEIAATQEWLRKELDVITRLAPDEQKTEKLKLLIEIADGRSTDEILRMFDTVNVGTKEILDNYVRIRQELRNEAAVIDGVKDVVWARQEMRTIATRIKTMTDTMDDNNSDATDLKLSDTLEALNTSMILKDPTYRRKVAAANGLLDTAKVLVGELEGNQEWTVEVLAEGYGKIVERVESLKELEVAIRTIYDNTTGPVVPGIANPDYGLNGGGAELQKYAETAIKYDEAVRTVEELRAKFGMALVPANTIAVTGAAPSDNTEATAWNKAAEAGIAKARAAIVNLYGKVGDESDKIVTWAKTKIAGLATEIDNQVRGTKKKFDDAKTACAPGSVNPIGNDEAECERAAREYHRAALELYSVVLLTLNKAGGGAPIALETDEATWEHKLYDDMLMRSVETTKVKKKQLREGIDPIMYNAHRLIRAAIITTDNIMKLGAWDRVLGQTPLGLGEIRAAINAYTETIVEQNINTTAIANLVIKLNRAIVAHLTVGAGIAQGILRITGAEDADTITDVSRREYMKGTITNPQVQADLEALYAEYAKQPEAAAALRSPNTPVTYAQWKNVWKYDRDNARTINIPTSDETLMQTLAKVSRTTVRMGLGACLTDGIEVLIAAKGTDAEAAWKQLREEVRGANAEWESGTTAEKYKLTRDAKAKLGRGGIDGLTLGELSTEIDRNHIAAIAYHLTKADEWRDQIEAYEATSGKDQASRRAYVEREETNYGNGTATIALLEAVENKLAKVGGSESENALNPILARMSRYTGTPTDAKISTWIAKIRTTMEDEGMRKEMWARGLTNAQLANELKGIEAAMKLPVGTRSVPVPIIALKTRVEETYTKYEDEIKAKAGKLKAEIIKSKAMRTKKQRADLEAVLESDMRIAAEVAKITDAPTGDATIDKLINTLSGIEDGRTTAELKVKEVTALEISALLDRISMVLQIRTDEQQQMKIRSETIKKAAEDAVEEWKRADPLVADNDYKALLKRTAISGMHIYGRTYKNRVEHLIRELTASSRATRVAVDDVKKKEIEDWIADAMKIAKPLAEHVDEIDKNATAMQAKIENIRKAEATMDSAASEAGIKNTVDTNAQAATLLGLDKAWSAHKIITVAAGKMARRTDRRQLPKAKGDAALIDTLLDEILAQIKGLAIVDDTTIGAEWKKVEGDITNAWNNLNQKLANRDDKATLDRIRQECAEIGLTGVETKGTIEILNELEVMIAGSGKQLAQARADNGPALWHAIIDRIAGKIVVDATRADNVAQKTKLATKHRDDGLERKMRFVLQTLNIRKKASVDAVGKMIQGTRLGAKCVGKANAAVVQTFLEAAIDDASYQNLIDQGLSEAEIVGITDELVKKNNEYATGTNTAVDANIANKTAELDINITELDRAIGNADPAKAMKGIERVMRAHPWLAETVNDADKGRSGIEVIGQIKDTMSDNAKRQTIASASSDIDFGEMQSALVDLTGVLKANTKFEEANEKAKFTKDAYDKIKEIAGLMKDAAQIANVTNTTGDADIATPIATKLREIKKLEAVVNLGATPVEAMDAILMKYTKEADLAADVVAPTAAGANDEFTYDNLVKKLEEARSIITMPRHANEAAETTKLDATADQDSARVEEAIQTLYRWSLVEKERQDLVAELSKVDYAKYSRKQSDGIMWALEMLMELKTKTGRADAIKKGAQYDEIKAIVNAVMSVAKAQKTAPKQDEAKWRAIQLEVVGKKTALEKVAKRVSRITNEVLKLDEVKDAAEIQAMANEIDGMRGNRTWIYTSYSENKDKVIQFVMEMKHEAGIRLAIEDGNDLMEIIRVLEKMDDRIRNKTPGTAPKGGKSALATRIMDAALDLPQARQYIKMIKRLNAANPYDFDLFKEITKNSKWIAKVAGAKKDTASAIDAIEAALNAGNDTIAPISKYDKGTTSRALEELVGWQPRTMKEIARNSQTMTAEKVTIKTEVDKVINEYGLRRDETQIKNWIQALISKYPWLMVKIGPTGDQQELGKIWSILASRKRQKEESFLGLTKDMILDIASTFIAQVGVQPNDATPGVDVLEANWLAVTEAYSKLAEIAAGTSIDNDDNVRIALDAKGYTGAKGNATENRQRIMKILEKKPTWTDLGQWIKQGIVNKTTALPESEAGPETPQSYIELVVNISGIKVVKDEMEKKHKEEMAKYLGGTIAVRMQKTKQRNIDAAMQKRWNDAPMSDKDGQDRKIALLSNIRTRWGTMADAYRTMKATTLSLAEALELLTIANASIKTTLNTKRNSEEWRREKDVVRAAYLTLLMVLNRSPEDGAEALETIRKVRGIEGIRGSTRDEILTKLSAKFEGTNWIQELANEHLKPTVMVEQMLSAARDTGKSAITTNDIADEITEIGNEGIPDLMNEISTTLIASDGWDAKEARAGDISAAINAIGNLDVKKIIVAGAAITGIEAANSAHVIASIMSNADNMSAIEIEVRADLEHATMKAALTEIRDAINGAAGRKEITSIGQVGQWTEMVGATYTAAKELVEETRKLAIPAAPGGTENVTRINIIWAQVAALAPELAVELFGDEIPSLGIKKGIKTRRIMNAVRKLVKAGRDPLVIRLELARAIDHSRIMQAIDDGVGVWSTSGTIKAMIANENLTAQQISLRALHVIRKNPTLSLILDSSEEVRNRALNQGLALTEDTRRDGILELMELDNICHDTPDILKKVGIGSETIKVLCEAINGALEEEDAIMDTAVIESSLENYMDTLRKAAEQIGKANPITARVWSKYTMDRPVEIGERRSWAQMTRSWLTGQGELDVQDYADPAKNSNGWNQQHRLEAEVIAIRLYEDLKLALNSKGSSIEALRRMGTNDMKEAIEHIETEVVKNIYKDAKSNPWYRAAWKLGEWLINANMSGNFDPDKIAPGVAIKLAEDLCLAIEEYQWDADPDNEEYEYIRRMARDTTIDREVKFEDEYSDGSGVIATMNNLRYNELFNSLQRLSGLNEARVARDTIYREDDGMNNNHEIRVDDEADLTPLGCETPNEIEIARDLDMALYSIKTDEPRWWKEHRAGRMHLAMLAGRAAMMAGDDKTSWRGLRQAKTYDMETKRTEKYGLVLINPANPLDPTSQDEYGVRRTDQEGMFQKMQQNGIGRWQAELNKGTGEYQRVAEALWNSSEIDVLSVIIGRETSKPASIIEGVTETMGDNAAGNRRVIYDNAAKTLTDPRVALMIMERELLRAVSFDEQARRIPENKKARKQQRAWLMKRNAAATTDRRSVEVRTIWADTAGEPYKNRYTIIQERSIPGAGGISKTEERLTGKDVTEVDASSTALNADEHWIVKATRYADDVMRLGTNIDVIRVGKPTDLYGGRKAKIISDAGTGMRQISAALESSQNARDGRLGKVELESSVAEYIPPIPMRAAVPAGVPPEQPEIPGRWLLGDLDTTTVTMGILNLGIDDEPATETAAKAQWGGDGEELTKEAVAVQKAVDIAIISLERLIELRNAQNRPEDIIKTRQGRAMAARMAEEVLEKIGRNRALWKYLRNRPQSIAEDLGSILQQVKTELDDIEGDKTKKIAYLQETDPKLFVTAVNKLAEVIDEAYMNAFKKEEKAVRELQGEWERIATLCVGATKAGVRGDQAKMIILNDLNAWVIGLENTAAYAGQMAMWAALIGTINDEPVDDLGDAFEIAYDVATEKYEDDMDTMKDHREFTYEGYESIIRMLDVFAAAAGKIMALKPAP